MVNGLETMLREQPLLALPLLFGAGLFVRSLQNLKATDTGFRNPENLVTFQLNPAMNGYSEARGTHFYEELLDQIEANGQVALRYAPGHNPNGSARDIAAVTNEAGNVLGLMPHPEHAVDALTGSVDGLRLFDGAARSAA